MTRPTTRPPVPQNYVVTLGEARESIRQFQAANEQQADLIAEQTALNFLVGIFGGVVKMPKGNPKAQREAVLTFLEKTFPGFMLRTEFVEPTKVGPTTVFTTINVTLKAD